MRVIIAGGRDFKDYSLLKEKCSFYLQNCPDVTVVCGEAKGADSLGKALATEKGWSVLSCPADWDKFGKRAGYLRNAEMAENADALIAFWDGSSKGTASMIEIAKKAGLPIKIVYY